MTWIDGFFMFNIISLKSRFIFAAESQAEPKLDVIMFDNAKTIAQSFITEMCNNQLISNMMDKISCVVGTLCVTY